MGFERRAVTPKYSPKDDDTLAKIAARESAKGNPLTAADIARFNWGTDDPDTIDEHLRDELGCYKRGADKGFLISKDVEARHDLLLPTAFKRTGLVTDQTHTLRVKRQAKPAQQFEGCVVIKGVCFEFDQSFIRPDVVYDLKRLEEAVQKKPEAKVLIFGHTDNVGSDEYNKALSERRALSTYAFITNKPEVWDDLYKAEGWGIKSVQAILKDMGGELDPGPVDGVNGSKTKAAVRKYQEKRSLTVDGVAGPVTRKALFKDYMAGKHDVAIDDDRFMEPKFMGCGEFNPAVTFTEEERRRFAGDHVLRDEKNEPNRRVTFYLFNKGRPPHLFCKGYTTEANCKSKPSAAQVKPSLAPCIRYGVKEAPGDARPRHREEFGCAWYDSIAKDCLVEGPPVVPRKAYPEIYFEELDRWFIPKEESCKLAYAIDGPENKADKVEMEVFASNYCKAKVEDDGAVTFSPVADNLVFTQEASAKGFESGKRREVTDWKGKSTAAEGILKPREGKERFINVACSPYTVHLRYLEEHATDTTARIDLAPFWPLWEAATATPTTTHEVQPAAIKVKWTNAAVVDRGVLEISDKQGQVVYLAELPEAKLAAGAQEVSWDKRYRADAENSDFAQEYLDDSADGANSKNAPYTYKITTITHAPTETSLKVRWAMVDSDPLASGRLRIVDAANKLVFEKSLSKVEVKPGEQSYPWDGKYKAGVTNSKGGDTAIREDMPYRVQLLAHTGMDVAYGVAVAAMHTEVRLYVHPESRAPSDPAYDAWSPKQSLALELGSITPGYVPAEGAGSQWFRYQLGEFGFHPGPVTDAAEAETAYKIALRDFKRAVPADGSVAAPNFRRQPLDGTHDEAEDDELKTAIKKLRASDKRQWFGDPVRVYANDHAPDLTDDDVRIRLPDPAQELIVWVDDRQYYTEGHSAKDENNRDYTAGSPAAVTFGLKNYRGDMTTKDGRVDTDGAAIARPWVPLQVALPLLSRDKGLYDTVAPPGDDAIRDAMRRAIGPLRVDWSFDELPREVSTMKMQPAPNGHKPAANKQYIRSRYYMAWAIEQNKAAHSRPDTGRSRTYTNCKESLGGIRPDDLATYFEKAFGTAKLSLAPWKATPVAATESVATVVHDDLDAAQVHYKSLFDVAVGKAGAYFHPSRIAGDGYRVRAAAQFEKFTGYALPNLDVLKARYPTAPQAHSARLRLWRKSSVRGYMCWGAGTGHWPGNLTALREDYRGGHVYFPLEQSANPDDHLFTVNDVFDPSQRSHRNRYKNIIANNVSKSSLKSKRKITLSATSVWPWCGRDDLGWSDPSPRNLSQARLRSHWLSRDVWNQTWRQFRSALLLALLKEVEKRGLLRGHLFVEFRDTPAFYCEEYRCDNGCKYWYIRRNDVAHGGKNGTSCPTPGCRHGFLNLLRTSLTATGRRRAYSEMGLPAVGVQLGATWLFDTSDGETWSHEVGHHRHFEHADNAPGAEYASSHPSADARLHDNEDNTTVANWGAVAQSAHPSQRDWDRLCTMTYVSTDPTTFCGKCLLRNRGWRVRGLGFPGTDKSEP